MSEDQLVDEFRNASGIEPPSTLESGVRIERRRARREPPKTLEDAHAIVQAIANRRVENARQVKTWRFVKQVVYLFVMIGAFLLYYFIEKIGEVLSLPSVGF